MMLFVGGQFFDVFRQCWVLSNECAFFEQVETVSKTELCGVVFDLLVELAARETGERVLHTPKQESTRLLRKRGRQTSRADYSHCHCTVFRGFDGTAVFIELPNSNSMLRVVYLRTVSVLVIAWLLRSRIIELWK